jgi:hypothetical protein
MTAHRPIKSLFILAFTLFLAVNFYFSFRPINFDPYKFNYHGWAWWTMNDLKNSSQVHNVAVLGSSTMVSAIASSDANYLNKLLDLTSYHKVSYLDNELSSKLGGTFDSFNLAAPGQMPADAYLSLKAMVASSHRPDIVIYGVAPRDFIDSTLSSPSDTEPFKYFTRLVNIDDVAFAVFRSPFARLDWLLQRALYLYGYSLDFRMAFLDATQYIVNTAIAKPYSNNIFTWWHRVRMLPGYLPGEIQPKGVIAGPIDRKTAESRFSDNTIEYQQRYRSPDPHTYKTQMYFLRKLAQFCHRERIELILVNMPITDYNIGMLKPGIYMNYVQSLCEFGIKNNITFYNLCDIARYPRKDFHDSVHLNAFGGKKFFDDLVKSITTDKRTSIIMAMSSSQLATHRALASSKKQVTY